MTATVAAMANEEYEFPHIYKRVLMGEPKYPEPMKSSLIADNKDKIFDMLTTMETDFNLEVEKVEDNPLTGFQHLLISPGTGWTEAVFQVKLLPIELYIWMISSLKDFCYRIFVFFVIIET